MKPCSSVVTYMFDFKEVILKFEGVLTAASLIYNQILNLYSDTSPLMAVKRTIPGLPPYLPDGGRV